MIGLAWKIVYRQHKRDMIGPSQKIVYRQRKPSHMKIREEQDGSKGQLWCRHYRNSSTVSIRKGSPHMNERKARDGSSGHRIDDSTFVQIARSTKKYLCASELCTG